MIIRIVFEELLSYVKRHYGVAPQLNCVDKKTLEVGYKPASFIPQITVRLRIEDICGEVVCLSYDCSKAMTLLITGAVELLNEKMPGGVKVDTTYRRIELLLNQIDALTKALTYIQPNDLLFNPNSIDLVVALK